MQVRRALAHDGLAKGWVSNERFPTSLPKAGAEPKAGAPLKMPLVAARTHVAAEGIILVRSGYACAHACGSKELDSSLLTQHLEIPSRCCTRESHVLGYCQPSRACGTGASLMLGNVPPCPRFGVFLPGVC
ncbi:MAG TPA: hypothetical protein VJ723_07540 [Candidatus Angelobacter sp.]|nr:hypothetical protein [Candidatus Angelobacter sp.]